MRHPRWLLTCALFMLTTLGTDVSVTHAAVGDLRRAVSISSAAQCGTGPGTALALVPGGKAGFATIPILLVSSCVAVSEGGTSSILIFFTDPRSFEGPAPVVKTLSTSFPSTAAAATKPSNGWEALVLRADKGDILGCGTNGTKTVLWSIDFSPFNAVVDGSATFLRNGPTGSSCGAIAWDPGDHTFYQTPASGFSVLHFKEDGTALNAIPVAAATCNTAITGLGIAGTSLFVGCGAAVGGAPSITQLAKTTGSAVRPAFAYAESSRLGGVADDPTTLAGESNELIWAVADSGEFVGFEMAGGTLSQKLGLPVLTPGACPGGNVSSDGDGLLDCWKSHTIWPDGLPGISYTGVYDGNVSHRDLVLCVPNPPVNPDADCAKPGRKDLYVEIDYMQFHRPTDAAVAAVKTAFAGAPTPPGPVALHVLVDEQITLRGSSHYTNLAFVPCTGPAGTADADYDAIKALFFGTAAERGSPNALNAKFLVYRYSLFVHNLLGLGTTSGCGEILGNDFVVAMGSWGSVNFGTASKPVFHNVGNQDQVTGTFLHEFGHTLGLRHGGGDNINCKPNYPSVMSYTSQFSTPISPTGVRPFDFSRGEFGVPIVLPDGSATVGLDKNSLDEGFGIGAAYTGPIAFGPVGAFATPTIAIAGGAINWNKTGGAADIVSLDVAQTTNASGGCPAAQPGPPGNADGRFLTGFDDWAHLQFGVGASVDVADGAHTTAGEPSPLVDPVTGALVARMPGMTFEEYLAFIHGLTNDGIEIRPGGVDNKINPRSSQTIQVAILSRADTPGTPGLDATTVDPATVQLRGMDPGTAALTWTVLVKRTGTGQFLCSPRDVNSDALPDLVCQFDLPRGLVGPGEDRALLQGQTFGGQSVLATDSFQQL